MLWEQATYYSCTDKIGSSSFITDANGEAYQFLQYLPFGESFISQRLDDWQARYTFSAKEKDEATGYHYFGARYYASEVSVWLSVDPMSDKYPHLSPYMYAEGNPVMLIDPWGLSTTEFINKKTNEKINIDDGSNETVIISDQKDWEKLKKVQKNYNDKDIINLKSSTHTADEISKTQKGGLMIFGNIKRRIKTLIKGIQ